MEANELRIGNWVEYFHDQNGFIQLPLDKEMFDLAYSVLEEKKHLEYDFNPIPLTEEWWPKFDYESIQEFACHISEKAEMYLGIHIDFYNDEGIQFIENLPIHKIQNLYFILTGEELEIK